MWRGVELRGGHKDAPQERSRPGVWGAGKGGGPRVRDHGDRGPHRGHQAHRNYNILSGILSLILGDWELDPQYFLFLFDE